MTGTERQAMLETALDRYITELAEGDLKPSYNINGQSVDWVRYREYLQDAIERTQQLIDTVADDGGIVEEVSQLGT